MIILIFPFIVSLFAIVFAFFSFWKINQAPAGAGKAIEVSLAIREGAIAYLKRQYKVVGLVSILFFLVFWLRMGSKTGIAFLMGAVFSALSGLIGMLVSTRANLKVVTAAQKGLKESFDLALRGGSVTGFLVSGLSLLLVSLSYLLFGDLKSLIALGFGSSLVSIFARLGGGIYTKAADVGADLVGKSEKNIPEDDPRNPAVIADQVGDNVGDCAGTAADVFETYTVSIIAAIILGKALFPSSPQIISLPLILASVSILASIISTFFIKLDKGQNIISAFYKGLIVAGILAALGFFPIICEISKSLQIKTLTLYVPALVGLLVTGGIFLVTDLYTSKKYWPVKSVAVASQSGHAPNIIAGLSVGLKSTVLPIVLISAGILISFQAGGLYGLAISAVSMLSLASLIITFDTYGPITDNAAGIAEMAGLPEEVRKNTDALDAVGNTTKEVTKGFTILSAALVALVLFSVYNKELINLGVKAEFLLEDPKVLVGLFIGGMITYYFSSLALDAVGKTATKVVEEVRRQFREIKGLMAGENKPEYGKCVDIVTRAALKEMILPAVITVLAPVLVGFLLGPETLGGVLIGSITVGLFLAISTTVSGAAWDNAKKYIEEGNLGGKGSFAHQAAITGDTVGDPYKDTVGPSINPMIKVINIVALLIVSFLI